jgi:predicted nucleotidyltransferase component of viral defense system
LPNNRPTRETTAGRAYLDLQNLARRRQRPTDELHQLYALEGFLARLTNSPYAENFVLKGGVLLAAFDTRRPTRDVDLSANRLPGDIDAMREVIQQIAAIRLDDGLDLHPDSATAETIREENEYAGVRITLTATLSVARLTFHIDINIGDPVHPAPQPISLPRLLGGTLQITGYPLTMVLAEKIVTMIQRGTANTRWRDFLDVYALTRHQTLDGEQLHASMTTVATYRQTPLAPLADTLTGFAPLAQTRWAAWRRRQHLDPTTPENFTDILTAITTFADPAITGQTKTLAWKPDTLTWQDRT